MSEGSPRSYLEPCLVFATGNAHRISELETILAPAWQDYASGTIARMSDFNTPVLLEDDATFEKSSLTKAHVLVGFTDLPVSANNSGICVDITGRTPRIFSAHWCGVYGDDAANLDLLLAQLTDVPDARRDAAFVSAVALVLPSGRKFVERGEIWGTFIRKRHGKGGFDYDLISVSESYSRTSAELSPGEKNAISYRSKAFRTLLPAIIETLKGK